MDDEVEIARKRALLRLNSSKVYSLMGLAVKAQEAQKVCLTVAHPAGGRVGH